MLTDKQMEKIIIDHYYWWEYTKYEPEYPLLYSLPIDLARSFEDHIRKMDDIDIIGLCWEENGKKEISNEEIKLFRTVAFKESNKFFKEFEKSIFAYPTKVFLGA